MSNALQLMLSHAEQDFDDLHGKGVLTMDRVQQHKVIMILYSELCNDMINVDQWLDKILDERLEAARDQMEERNGEPS